MAAGPEDRGNVTLKFGDRHDAPWLTIYGGPQEIKRQIEEAVEIGLIDLIRDTSVDIQAAWAVRSKLGGTSVVDLKSSSSSEASEPAFVSPAEPAQEDQPNAHLHKLIGEAADKAALMKLFADNKAAFSSDKALQSAFRDRTSAVA